MLTPSQPVKGATKHGPSHRIHGHDDHTRDPVGRHHHRRGHVPRGLPPGMRERLPERQSRVGHRPRPRQGPLRADGAKHLRRTEAHARHRPALVGADSPPTSSAFGASSIKETRMQPSNTLRSQKMLAVLPLLALTLPTAPAWASGTGEARPVAGLPGTPPLPGAPAPTTPPRPGLPALPKEADHPFPGGPSLPKAPTIPGQPWGAPGGPCGPGLPHVPTGASLTGPPFTLCSVR